MDELIDVERKGWQALVDGRGADFYELVMADDGLMLLPGVGQLEKPDAIDGLRKAPPWSWFEMDEERVVPLSTTAAVVAYRARAQRDEDPVYEALMSSTYAHRNGQWRLVVHQQTPDPRS